MGAVGGLQRRHLFGCLAKESLSASKGGGSELTRGNGGSLVQWYDQSLVGKTNDLNILNNLLEYVNNDVDKEMSFRYSRGTTVKWGERSFRCWFKEDERAWTPDWVGMPVNSQAMDRNPVAMSTTRGNLSNSYDDSVEDTPLHGSRSCMGKVNPVPLVQRNFRVEADGGGASDPPIPDLNASMGARVTEIRLDDSPNSVNMECGETTSKVNGVDHLEQEVQDTIRLGKELGIELENAADQVRAAIIGEMEDAIAQ
ncbi:hypothetical protein L1987_24432 [Smallanthus sonchifolius]|uniref:Uncharacterized protein n=1 Tax=Smallanthus sonchifolius TaxID=185202 RepID=A0ACB9ILV4_9ASTR|nr:hypothetical protein L1987_24432 [Smallanthus sonchifolius]